MHCLLQSSQCLCELVSVVQMQGLRPDLSKRHGQSHTAGGTRIQTQQPEHGVCTRGYCTHPQLTMVLMLLFQTPSMSLAEVCSKRSLGNFNKPPSAIRLKGHKSVNTPRETVPWPLCTEPAPGRLRAPPSLVCVSISVTSSERFSLELAHPETLSPSLLSPHPASLSSTAFITTGQVCLCVCWLCAITAREKRLGSSPPSICSA